MYNENIDQLYKVANKLVSDHKGLLAADESVHTANSRLEEIGLVGDAELRRQYRDLFLSTPGIEEYLNGVILFDETVYQKNQRGDLFINDLHKHGILPGIKVDFGTVDLINFPGEVVTEGLDGLGKRLSNYYKLGLTFAKWRSVTVISDNTPTSVAILTNMQLLARYAAICQSELIVPIVEPEVLLTGNHTLEKAEEVTTGVLNELFQQLKLYRVDLRSLILKTSMVVPGDNTKEVIHSPQIGQATARCLLNTVPPETAGVVFLSGGQSPDEATINLNEIVKDGPYPWKLTFSFARAIQTEAMHAWRGKAENLTIAREKFINRLKLEVEANRGVL